jgi:hypothetical protein
MMFYFVSPADYPLKPKGSIPIPEDGQVTVCMHPKDSELDATKAELAIEIQHPSLDQVGPEDVRSCMRVRACVRACTAYACVHL